MVDRDVTAEIAAAWALRDKGASVREVAEHLGVSVSTAHARIRAAADAESVTGDPDDRRGARIREAAALDAWAALAERHAEQADDPIPAIRALTALSARRSRLLGLDAPQRVQVGDDRRAPEPDAELVAAIEQARQTRDADRRAALGEVRPAS